MSTKVQVESGMIKDLFHSEGENDEWKFVATEEGDSGRWAQYCTAIFENKTDRTFWAFNYEVGLTENQDSTYPWDNYYGSGIRDAIELFRVYPASQITTIWKRWDDLATDTNTGKSTKA